MSDFDKMKAVLVALFKYGQEYDNHTPEELNITLSLAGKWSKRKMDEICQVLANDRDMVGLIYHARKEVQEITGNDNPLFLPSVEAAKTDKKLMAQIVANGCAFIAMDDPKQSVALVRSYLIIVDISKRQGVHEHYQVINADKLSKGRRYRQKKSNEFASSLKNLFPKLAKEGINTYQGMADRLNAMEIPTPSGNGKWHINTVQRVKKQLELQGKSKKTERQELVV